MHQIARLLFAGVLAIFGVSLAFMAAARPPLPERVARPMQSRVVMLLHVMLYAVVALFGWLALLLGGATLVAGRSWVADRTREAGADLAWRLRHRHRVLRSWVCGQTNPWR